MMTSDPNRLIMIIKDREVMLRRLRKALKDSIEDGYGDCFKINRFVKHHEVLLKGLYQDFEELRKESYALQKVREHQYAKIEQGEVDSLRASLRLYDIEDRRL